MPCVERGLTWQNVVLEAFCAKVRPAMKLTKGFTGLFDRILDYFSFFTGLLVAFMMLAVTYEVIMRSLGRPSMWVQEIVEISLLYITFLAIAAVARKGAHVKMDAVFNQLRPRIQAYLNIILYELCKYYWTIYCIWIN